MTIRRIPFRDGTTVSLRDHQVRMTEVGRIRTGIFDPSKGRSGAPAKLDTFRFTSANEDLIREAAGFYGGTVATFTPQRGTGEQWETIVPTNEVDVYVPRQRLEPWLEAWRPGTCIRRCDGVTETIKQEPCPCAANQVPANDLCKPVIRVQVLLADVPVIGTWRLEPHGEYAVSELATLAPLIEQVQMPIPAKLRLRQEQRQHWNAEKGKFDRTTFYVPHLIIAVATPRQMIEGTAGVAMEVEAVRQSSAPALGASGPENAPAATSPEPARQETSTVRLADGDWETIARVIEGATTVARLVEIAEKLRKRGVTDPRPYQAAESKIAALEAAKKLARQQHQAALKEAAVQPDRTTPETEPAADTHYDKQAEFLGLVADVGPTWTTAQVHDAVKQALGVARTQDATGAQLREVRERVKAGWRPS